MSSFLVSNKYILSVINSLDGSKSHGYDNVSTKMIKTCSESYLQNHYKKKSIKKESFPEIWKKVNAVPAHKK